MDKENDLGRVLALLLLTGLMCAGLYYLPDTLLGYTLKKVDLLSDFKVREDRVSLDSLRLQLERADTLEVDSAYAMGVYACVEPSRLLPMADKEYGFFDFHISCAPADIPPQSFLHFLCRRRWICIYEGLCRHYHAGRAESALYSAGCRESIGIYSFLPL